jgi:hypothetical protein
VHGNSPSAAAGRDRSIAEKKRFKAIVPGNHGRMILLGRDQASNKKRRLPEGKAALFDRDT